MTTISSANLSIPIVLSNPDSLKLPTILKSSWLKTSNTTPMRSGRMYMRPVMAAPEGLSEKIASSIESAKESCADDPASGECVAAWEEVEELSAASSHARDRLKDTNPLEIYCKENPETDECRTYED